MFAIRTKNGLLNGFYSNDLPTTRKLFYNEDNNRLEPKFTVKNMMNCSGGYMFFETPGEAQQHIDYIKREIEDSRTRYERSLEGSTDKILCIVNDFKVVTIQQEGE